jgi:glycosyltransferase involved in cell wall biosynthesis
MKPKILTTVPIPQNKNWCESTYLIEFKYKRYLSGINILKKFGIFKKIESYTNHIFFSLYLFKDRTKFDVAIMFTSNYAMFFALLQKIFPKKKIPIVTIGSYINKQKSSIKYYVKSYLINLVNKLVFFTTEEINNYSEYFKIDKSKFQFIPFSDTLSGYDYTIEKGDYIFCAGNGFRDYEVIIDAVRNMSVEVILPCLDRAPLKKINIPKNVKILTVSHEEYRKLMARSRITVVPIKGGELIGGGVQSYLNAMLMGKPVIVSDTAGARDYIVNGETGFLFRPGDVSQLRNIIETLIKNDSEAQRVGMNAMKEVRDKYTLDRYVKDILNVAAKLLSR